MADLNLKIIGIYDFLKELNNSSKEIGVWSSEVLSSFESLERVSMSLKDLSDKTIETGRASIDSALGLGILNSTLLTNTDNMKQFSWASGYLTEDINMLTSKTFEYVSSLLISSGLILGTTLLLTGLRDLIVSIRDESGLAYEPLRNILVNLLEEAKPFLEFTNDELKEMRDNFNNLSPKVEDTWSQMDTFLGILDSGLGILEKTVEHWDQLKNVFRYIITLKIFNTIVAPIVSVLSVLNAFAIIAVGIAAVFGNLAQKMSPMVLTFNEYETSPPDWVLENAGLKIDKVSAINSINENYRDVGSYKSNDNSFRDVGSKLLAFGDGGVVPGPIGMPRLIVAHGGETLIPTHKPGVRDVNTQEIHFHGDIQINPKEIEQIHKILDLVEFARLKTRMV